jgi:hypothetical protein
MTTPHKHPSIKETRQEILRAIRATLETLKQSNETPLMIAALESQLSAFLLTLPASYRGDAPND